VPVTDHKQDAVPPRSKDAAMGREKKVGVFQAPYAGRDHERKWGIVEGGPEGGFEVSGRPNR